MQLYSPGPVHGDAVADFYQYGGEVRLQDGWSIQPGTGRQRADGVDGDFMPLAQKHPACAHRGGGGRRVPRRGALGLRDPGQASHHRDPQRDQPDFLVLLVVGKQFLVSLMKVARPFRQ